jgi:predicted TIM-barrel fold metal-dependent hydrolase
LNGEFRWMSENNRPIIKIPDVSELGYSIHDFHCQMDPTFSEDRTKFGIKSVCIMPTWRNLQTFDFHADIPNDFKNPIDYIKKLKDLKQSITGWKGKIYMFLPVDFSKNQSEFSELLKNNRVAGIKLDPLQNFKIDHETLDPYIIPAKERNLIVYVHTDWVPSTEWKKVKNLMPETFIKIVKMYPDVTFIMGHSGFNDSYVSVWKWVKKYPNIIAETSFAPSPAEVEKIMLKADDSRVVFGSSFPLSPTSMEIMKIVKMTRLSKDQIKAVLYDNAMALLKDKPYLEVGI